MGTWGSKLGKDVYVQNTKLDSRYFLKKETCCTPGKIKITSNDFYEPTKGPQKPEDDDRMVSFKIGSPEEREYIRSLLEKIARAHAFNEPVDDNSINPEGAYAIPKPASAHTKGKSSNPQEPRDSHRKHANKDKAKEAKDDSDSDVSEVDSQISEDESPEEIFDGGSGNEVSNIRQGQVSGISGRGNKVSNKRQGQVSGDNGFQAVRLNKHTAKDVCEGEGDRSTEEEVSEDKSSEEESESGSTEEDPDEESTEEDSENESTEEDSDSEEDSSGEVETESDSGETDTETSDETETGSSQNEEEADELGQQSPATADTNSRKPRRVSFQNEGTNDSENHERACVQPNVLCPIPLCPCPIPAPIFNCSPPCCIDDTGAWTQTFYFPPPAEDTDLNPQEQSIIIPQELN